MHLSLDWQLKIDFQQVAKCELGGRFNAVCSVGSLMKLEITCSLLVLIRTRFGYK